MSRSWVRVPWKAQKRKKHLLEDAFLRSRAE
jgi:hypothetical protein